MKKTLLYTIYILSLFLFVNTQKGLCNNKLEWNAVEDSLELINFYNATGGPNWTNTWDLTQPMSTWFGVELNADGCVTGLCLSGTLDCGFSADGNNLVGSIPNLNLPNLQLLKLSSNNISGNIPDFVNLPNLLEFECYACNLSGSIPDFPNSPNLTLLSVGYNNLSGSIPDFSNVPNLVEFYCNSNQLTGEIPDFSNLNNIEDIFFHHNNLTGSIPNFSNLPSLIRLECNFNNLSGEIPDFSNLPNFEIFECAFNDLSGSIPDFTNLPKLSRFGCYFNDLSGTIPDFSNTPDLLIFSCSNNNLSGEIPDFSNTPLLQDFNCWENDLSGAIPNFSNTPELYRFDCNNNNLSGNIPDFSMINNLTDLICSNNQLTGTIPELDFLNLTKFEFESNNLEGCYPLGLCNVHNVSSFNNPGLPDSGSEIAFQNFCTDASSQFGLPCDDGDNTTPTSFIQPDCSCFGKNPFVNFVEGKIFMDTTLNCIFDSEESPLSNWLITAVGDSATYYDVSDTLGDYKIFLDTGDFTLHVELPNGYWGICPAVEDSLMTFVNPEDTFLIDIPLEVDFLCPVPTVDISTPFLRRCFASNYAVAYCNDGTAPLEGGYIVIQFDEFLTVNSSTFPWTDQEDNTYTFLIDDLDVNECDSFQINVTVECDSTELGQTHCVQACIYPDSICFPTDGFWDGSTIQLEAICETDSLKFLINNIGDNDMLEPGSYIIIEDDLILRTGTFMIPAGGSDSTYQEKTGATYRIEAEQSDFHPTNSAPSISVEGCVDNDEPFSMGFVNIFPENDAAPFISIDCQENIGSYDPNDKIGYPIGLGSNHYINNDTELEYRIRFQNTGTDTAFTVKIRDTLSALLDPATIKMGASSHAYDWTILGTNTLELVFNNIMLPDSNVNEIASHGFFKFKIKQQPENLPGTVIHNSAAIYFDFNEPVITNSTFHTLEESLNLNEVSSEAMCDHWFYTTDSTVNMSSEFSYYDLSHQHTIDLIENQTTYQDTLLTIGTTFMGETYDEDTVLPIILTDLNGCDSLVVYNIQIKTDISESEKYKAITIYPNPANEKVFMLFELSEPLDGATIKIYNQIGQEIKTVSLEKSYAPGKHIESIDVSDINEGIYLLNIQSATFSRIRKVMIK